MSNSPGVASRVLLWMLDFYQKGISPLMPPSCRFEPTCSNYAIDAVRMHGPWIGPVLATWRLLKCGPWHRGGWDPVPERAFGHQARLPARTGPDPDPDDSA